jgi:hypothetical protein
MIKFTLCARRRRENTVERYYYEWGIIHVALMITTPQVMRTFAKYVQHYTIQGISNDILNFPLSTMEWDNMANHYVRDNAGLVDAMHATDYVIRMQPHKFGDPNFVVQLVTEETVYDSGLVKSGGVKLTQFLNPAKGIEDDAFLASWKGEYAANIIKNSGNGGAFEEIYAQHQTACA